MNVKLLVDGGGMKPGPALSQKLGPAGININEVITKVNKETEGFKGMKVPVELEIDLGTKKFEVIVFSPPAAELIKKEVGADKGSGLHKKMNIGNLSIEQVISIAKAKKGNLLCRDLKSSVKTILGSCVSLGVLVESKSPIEVQQEIDQGIYDKQIKNEISETPEEKKKELNSFFAKLKAEQDKKLKAEAKPEDTTTKKKKK